MLAPWKEKRAMKKRLLYYTLALTLLAIFGACDNGNSDPIIIDGPPTITIGTITSGGVAGEDFRIDITLSDGVNGSTISTLATLNWAITGGGATVASGTESLTGDNQVVTLSVAGGFAAGDYNLDLTATDTNGNSSTDNYSFTVASGLFDITGEWRMDPVAGAFKVGPTAGSGEWWSSGAGDVDVRACHFDDIYTFNEDGSFAIDMGDATWLETWQGVDPDQCGTPVAPFVSSTAFTYSYSAGSLTLIGRGAAVGLAKVNNEGEISQGAAVADQITYNITSQTEEGEARRMTLQIEAADGVWWEFLLISGTPPETPIDVIGDWKLEPVAGALGVGPGQGNTSWWSSSADDVTGRACLFDDVYSFAANGTFTMDMGTESWIEPWQGVDPEACGALVAPHNGSGSFTWQLSGTDLKVIGTGAHIGLAKVFNGAELTNPADAPDDITYIVSDFTVDGTTKRMTLDIKVGGDGWWQFKLISE